MQILTLDQIRARFQVLFMDAFDQVGLSETEQVMQALEVPARVLEPIAAISSFVELVLLHHRAHRAVEDDDPAREQLGQRCDRNAGLHRPAQQRGALRRSDRVSAQRRAGDARR